MQVIEPWLVSNLKTHSSYPLMIMEILILMMMIKMIYPLNSRSKKTKESGSIFTLDIPQRLEKDLLMPYI